jgi:hypothetical protein
VREIDGTIVQDEDEDEETQSPTRDNPASTRDSWACSGGYILTGDHAHPRPSDFCPRAARSVHLLQSASRSPKVPDLPILSI